MVRTHIHTLPHTCLRSPCLIPVPACVMGVLRVNAALGFPGAFPEIIFFFPASYPSTQPPSHPLHLTHALFFLFTPPRLGITLSHATQCERDKPGLALPWNLQPSKGGGYPANNYTSGYLITVVINARKKDVFLLLPGEQPHL